MILEFLYIGIILSFVLAFFAFLKLIPYANIVSCVSFLAVAVLLASTGLDIPTDSLETETIVDANTTTTATETVYTNYGYSSVFVFVLFWLLLALSGAMALHVWAFD